MKRILLWSLLALLPTLALAEDEAGLERLRASAVSGDVESMLELGILYEYGFRMPNNKAPALAWYRLAAEAGNVKARERHDSLKASMSGAEIEESNSLYLEYSALRGSGASSAPVAQPETVTVQPVEPAPTDSAESAATD